MTSTISVHDGTQAQQLLQDTAFIAAWRRLHANSAGATVFQSPEFVGVWYSHYRDQFAPWLIMQRGTDGELLALLTLAHDQRAGTLIVAGGHQAEYQAWLARSDRSEGFIAQAWHAIRKRLPATTLTFHYLPPTFPRGAWMAAPLRGLIEPSVRRRPLMQLLPERVEESLRKKSNKSKLNRLAKLGEVRLERLRSAQALDPWFDEIVTHYDLRQGATHDSCPFQTDAQKRAFHLALAEHPELLHVTVLSVGGKFAAAHIGAITNDTVHLGVIAHSPLYAEHSVGKLQLLLLARHLAGEGFKTFDLTPGDDPWKERFADAHDDVIELRMYPNAMARVRAMAPRQLLALAKRAAGVVGITPDRVRRWGAGAHSADLATDVVEWWTSKTTVATKSVATLARNTIAHLLLPPAKTSAHARRQFLSDASARLENGEHLYTAACDGKLRYCAWGKPSAAAQESATLLHDVQGFDDDVETLFEQNLALLTAPLIVEVPKGATNLAGVLNRLGFERSTNGLTTRSA